jgi:hypothetical protein
LTRVRDSRYAGPVLTARELIAQDALRQISVGQWTRDPRRVDMNQRLRIDREDFHDLSAEWIRDRYDTPEVAMALCKFIDPSANLLQRITDKLAVAYRQPPTRFIRDDEAASANWSQLMKQARVHTVAKTWGRYSFLLNVTFVVPVVRPMMDGDTSAPTLSYHIILPDRIVAAFFGEDPRWPDVIICEHQDGDAEPGYMPGKGKPVYVAIDAEGYTYFSSSWEVVDFRPNGVGRKLHVPFRVNEGQPGDFWDRTRGRKLVTSTLEISRIWAAMSYVRKGQNRKLLTLFAANLDGIPDQQIAEPEKALMAEGEPGSIDLSVRDFETGVGGFANEIKLRIETVAESYGIPSTMIDLSSTIAGAGGDYGNLSQLANTRSYAALAEIRDSQIEHLREAEHELAYRTALVLEATRHPLAVDPETVREQFEIVWPPLTFVEHPLVQVQVAEKKMALGLADHATVYQEMHPWLTLTQAQARVMGHIDRRNEYNAALAARNMTANPADDAMGLAQLQGRIGGETARKKREEEEQD